MNGYSCIRIVPELQSDRRTIHKCQERAAIYANRDYFNRSLMNSELNYSIQHVFCAMNNVLFNGEHGQMKANKFSLK